MKLVRTYLECLSFLLWIVFTILSVAVAGLSIEGILFAAFMLMVSSTQPVHVPLAAALLGGLGVFLSVVWRQVGVDHLHYLKYDSPAFFETQDESDSPSRILKELILEVENSDGYARNDVRAKAKTWLIGHVSTMDEEDILLAKAHFGYLLPAGWGGEAKPLARQII